MVSNPVVSTNRHLWGICRTVCRPLLAKTASTASEVETSTLARQVAVPVLSKHFYFKIVCQAKQLTAQKGIYQGDCSDYSQQAAPFAEHTSNLIKAACSPVTCYKPSYLFRVVKQQPQFLNAILSHKQWL